MREIEAAISDQAPREMRKHATATCDRASREAQEREATIRDQVSREIARLLNVTKFGEQVIAERLHDALLNQSTVSAITALSAATTRGKIAAGAFPRPVNLSNSASRWFLTEVAPWIVARRDERDEARREDLLRKARLGVAVESPPKHIETMGADVTARNARAGKTAPKHPHAEGGCNV